MAEVSSLFYAYVNSLTADQQLKMASLLDQITMDIGQQITVLTARFAQVTGNVNTTVSKQLTLTDQVSQMGVQTALIQASPQFPLSPDLQSLNQALVDASIIYQNMASGMPLTTLIQSQVDIANTIRSLKKQQRFVRLYRNILKFRMGIG